MCVPRKAAAPRLWWQQAGSSAGNCHNRVVPSPRKSNLPHVSLHAWPSSAPFTVSCALGCAASSDTSGQVGVRARGWGVLCRLVRTCSGVKQLVPARTAQKVPELSGLALPAQTSALLMARPAVPTRPSACYTCAPIEQDVCSWCVVAEQVGCSQQHLLRVPWKPPPVAWGAPIITSQHLNGAREASACCHALTRASPRGGCAAMPAAFFWLAGSRGGNRCSVRALQPPKRKTGRVWRCFRDPLVKGFHLDPG